MRDLLQAKKLFFDVGKFGTRKVVVKEVKVNAILIKLYIFSIRLTSKTVSPFMTRLK